MLALGLNIAMLIAGIALSIAFAWLPVSAWNIHDPFFLGQMQQQTMRIWMLMSVLALLIIVANTSVARAYQSAPAPLIAALDYSYLGFVLGWSWLFFADIPDAATLAGMAFIAIAGWFVI